jgi:hypothetical protein
MKILCGKNFSESGASACIRRMADKVIAAMQSAMIVSLSQDAA